MDTLKVKAAGLPGPRGAHTAHCFQARAALPAPDITPAPLEHSKLGPISLSSSYRANTIFHHLSSCAQDKWPLPVNSAPQRPAPSLQCQWRTQNLQGEKKESSVPWASVTPPRKPKFLAMSEMPHPRTRHQELEGSHGGGVRCKRTHRSSHSRQRLPRTCGQPVVRTR